jgi:hypothetical protein
LTGAQSKVYEWPPISPEMGGNARQADRQADLRCYGSKFHESPSLDKLAGNGMRFNSHGTRDTDERPWARGPRLFHCAVAIRSADLAAHLPVIG